MTLDTDAKHIMALAIENGDKRSLALAAESMQRLYEYLDEMETMPLDMDTSVIVQINGQAVKFKSINEVTEWITANAS